MNNFYKWTMNKRINVKEKVSLFKNKLNKVTF